MASMQESAKEKLKSPMMTVPLLVIFVVAAMVFSRNALATLESETNLFVAVGVIQLATIALPCMIYYLLKGRKLEEPVQVVSKNGLQLTFLIFAALFFISGSLLIKFLYFLGGYEASSAVNYYQSISAAPDSATHIEIILAFIVIPAICEEILFRGIVLSEYRKYGTANAVIVSAACFAMLHFSLESFVIYFFTGLVLSFVAAVSRSIIPAIALHILSNTLNIYASDSFLRVTMVKNGEYFIGFVLTVLTGLTLILMLARLENIFHTYSEKPPVEAVPPKSSANWHRVFFSPAFILLVIIFICVSLYL